MRVAIAGAGNVGQFIAADLLAAGHQVTMIEKDLHVLEVARPSLKEPSGSRSTPARSCRWSWPGSPTPT